MKKRIEETGNKERQQSVGNEQRNAVQRRMK